MSISADRTSKLSTPLDASEDIEEAARIQLQHSPYRALRLVSCRYRDDGTLVLIGKVPTYHYKQLAQTAVAGIDGVTRIDNAIEVDSAPHK